MGADPVRRRRRPDPADRVALEDRRRRALEEPLEVEPRNDAPYRLAEVRNPAHGTRYLVMLPDYPLETAALCTCTDFARRGLGTCKHIAATVRWYGQHSREIPAPPPPDTGLTASLWEAIERGAGAVDRTGETDVRAIARPGSLLWESEAPRRRHRP